MDVEWVVFWAELGMWVVGGLVMAIVWLALQCHKMAVRIAKLEVQYINEEKKIDEHEQSIKEIRTK